MSKRTMINQSYLLHINEAQRKALIEVLRQTNIHQMDDEPLEYWIEMLRELEGEDQIAENDQQTINGFCL